MVVGFLRTKDGRCPVEDFLDDLSAKDAQKVLWVLRLIEHVDRVPASYLKKLLGTEEIWEVRVQAARQTFRILAFLDADHLWLMNGYSKKSRRTDAQQIERAQQMRRDYFQESGD